MESLINVLKEVSKYVESTTDVKKEHVIRMLELIEGHREDHISDVLSLLKEFGANPTCADIDGNTAFHNVMRLPFLGVPKETVMDLCERLYDFKVPLTKGNHHGETPLLFCLSRSLENLEEEDKSSAMKTLVDVCTFLVNHGSNIEETTKSGESVFHFIMNLFQQGLQIRNETARKNVIHEALKLLKLLSPEKVMSNVVNRCDYCDLNSPLHLWASLAPSPNYGSSESFRDTLEKILQHLLKLRTNLSARNEYEETPLHLCKTWTAVKLLLDVGANPNDVDSSGSPPLLVAAKKNFGLNLDHLYPDILEDPDEFWGSAIKMGLEPWTVNKHDMSVFGVLLHSEALILAKALVNVTCKKPNAHRGTILLKMTNALFYAVQQSNNESVVRVLIDADVNKTDNEGKTALFYAVQQSNRESVVRALIDAGADVKITDKKGKNALFYAVEQRNNESVLRTLIDAGADVNKTNKMGNTALFYAVQQRNNENVVRALIDAGADVKITDKDGKTTLFYAVQQSNNQSVVRALIDAGADVKITDNEGKTALFYAVDRNAVDALIEEYEALINARDQYGRTALFYAVKQDSMTTARYLIEKGANLYLKDKCGVSIFTFFVERFRWATLTSYVSELFQEQRQLNSLAVKVLDVIFCQAPLLSTKGFYLPTQYIILNKTYLLEALTFARNQRFPQDDDKREAIDKIEFLITEDKVDVPSILTLLNTLDANPDAADSDGNTALHYATLLPLYDVSQETVIDICKKLKDLGAMFDVKNQQQQSPLLLSLSVNNLKAVETIYKLHRVRGLVRVCRFLLNSGSSVNETSQIDESAFHLLLKFVHKYFNVQGSKQPDVLQELIELLRLVSSKALERGKENIANKTDSHLNSPLHLWASLTLPSPQDYSSRLTKDHTFENIFQLIFDILLACGAKLNPRNENEDTPLHLCKTWGAVKLLIDAGANTNDLNSSKRSPLLVAAKEKTYLEKPGCFYPDFVDDPQTFWKSALKEGLDPWTADKDGESVLSILVESEAFPLAKSLVDVACKDDNTKSEPITISLLNALCKDKSVRTNWKANLVQDILKSRKSFTSLSKALRYCCENVIETGVRDVKQEDKADSAVAALVSGGDDDDAPPPKRRTTDELDGKSEAQADLYQGPVTVHCEIIKLLRWYGASGEAFEEIAKDYSQLSDLLLKPLTDEQIKEFIPWTSVSKKYKDKLAKVARRQEYKVINQISIWYHKDHIGSGAFSDIFAGINEKDGREVAIKRIVKLRLQRPQDKREIQNLTALADCRQVVRYVSFCEDQDFCYVVLELMEGNLEEYLNESTIDATEATLLCKDVVMGLKFLHEQNILHRDLKPQNILYKAYPKLCLKIADFGLSRRIDSTSTTVYGTNAGTRCWIAPEILKSPPKDHSKSSDIFSCGLVLHYTLSGRKHPFSPVDCVKKSESQVSNETEANLMNGKMEGWDDSLSPAASHLVRKMIESTVENRPTAEQAIDHPLFWTKEKKIDLLKAVGNQPAFESPRAKKAMVLTAWETDLENSFGIIVKYGTWNDSGFVHMPAIYTEMTRWRSYDTRSVVALVRFIRNAYEHVSEDTRPSHIRKLLLDDFVFVEYFPDLVMEVYKAVTTHGWDQTRDEIKYAMRNK